MSASTPAYLLQLQETIRRVFRLLVVNADTDSDLLDLPVGQLRCLRQIMEQDGCKLVDLARETNLSLPNASRLVDRLVQRQLVLRDTDPSDRRAIRLHATPEARALIESINNQRLRHIGTATRSLDRDQIDRIVSDLQVLISAAEKAQSEQQAQLAAPDDSEAAEE